MPAMKVALVFPRRHYPSGDPPLGILYLAARLRERTGLVPKILDTTFDRDAFAHLRQELMAEKYDLVGISAMVTMARDANAAADLCKQVRPETKVILGGPHPTTLAERVLENPAVDAVGLGEGEDTLVEVVEREGFAGVPGVWYREGGEIRKNPPRPWLQDLDQLPFPAFDLLDLEPYLQGWFQLDTVRPGLRGTSVLATRGCPFQCTYCQPTLERLFGRGLRQRSPGHVVDELQELQGRFGLNAFLFADDTFIADRAWVQAFCRELRSRKLGIIWGCNVRADLARRELLAEMFDAGLRNIRVGIETYSDTIRQEVFRKKITREQVEEVTADAWAMGLSVQGYFMLGAPGETREDIRETVRWARRLPIHDATFNLTTPLPGTYLFEKFQTQVAVAEEDMDYYRRYAFTEGSGLSQGWLSRQKLWAYITFYLRPDRLGRLLRLVFGPGGWSRFAMKLRRVL
jgi:radical SAM superfamily enzyme YgiQ (UPF0313 family)